MLNAPVDWLLIAICVVGYLFIMFEQSVKIGKATSALLMGVIAWIIEFSRTKFSHEEKSEIFGEHLSNIAQIIIFIVGVLTIVEVINSHDGFRFIKNYLAEKSKRKVLWIAGAFAFFLSAVLGSLTMTIVLIALISKIAENVEDRWIIGSGILLAGNAGGAFSPVGDITSTMLWIGEQLTSSRMVLDLFVPSLVCAVIALLLLQWRLKGNFPSISYEEEKISPISFAIFCLGVGAILLVPIMKGLTGLPPFMGILLGLSVIWLVTDLLHRSEEKAHLTIPRIITKLDLRGAIFFLGILLAIDALQTAGILGRLAKTLLALAPSPTWISLSTALVSAVIDNIPLTAGMMGMFPLEQFPTNHFLWQLLAYSAGVGGSILLIGSATGVAFMSMEKVPLKWYLKNISIPALLAFVAGFLTYKFFICQC